MVDPPAQGAFFDSGPDGADLVEGEVGVFADCFAPKRGANGVGDFFFVVVDLNPAFPVGAGRFVRESFTLVNFAVEESLFAAGAESAA